MPLNAIYRSSVGERDGLRYYFEIIPRDNSELTSPSMIDFPLHAIDSDWEIDDNNNDDVLGIKRPRSLNLTIDLMKVPTDLANYLTDPFIERDIASDFPYRYPTNIDVPKIQKTNVWVYKTDEGNDALAVDDFTINTAFELKKNPSQKHKIVDGGRVQKHKLDMVFFDIARITLEQMHPIYFNWLAKDDIDNNTRFTPKAVEHVYDILYRTDGTSADYYNVRVRSKNSYPSGGTIDGVALNAGDKVLYDDLNQNRVKVFEWNGSFHELLRSYKTETIVAGDRFFVSEGTYANKLYRVDRSESDPYSGLGILIVIHEINDVTALEEVIAKLDGNFGATAYYFPIDYTFDSYFVEVFNFIYKDKMRVPQSNTDYELAVTRDIIQTSIRFYRQSYKRTYEKGTQLGIGNVYFLGLFELAGNYSGGFFQEGEDGPGMFEYENLYDWFENIKGLMLTAWYYHNDKEVRLVYDNVDPGYGGDIAQNDLYFGSDTEKEIEVNSDTKRGGIVNINVEADNINEFKHTLQGTLADDEASFKAWFHNNPSVKFQASEWKDTDNYPELKTSLTRNVKAEKHFDPLKLVYFETPTDLCDSEIAVRVHSATTIRQESEDDYFDLPFTILPLTNPFKKLPENFLLLQKYSGSPHSTAISLANYFSKTGRAKITGQVKFKQAIGMKPGARYIYDIQNLLINNYSIKITDRFILTNVKPKGDSQYADIELRGILNE